MLIRSYLSVAWLNSRQTWHIYKKHSRFCLQPCSTACSAKSQSELNLFWPCAPETQEGVADKGRVRKERQLKVIALVYTSVNSSQSGSNLFNQSSKYMKCTGVLLLLLQQWDAGKCDSSFLNMNH